MNTDYQKQATDYISKHGLAFKANVITEDRPPWDDVTGKEEVYHYRVTLSGKRDTGKTRRITFDFWGSIADHREGKKELTAYDALSCLSSDAFAPSTFEAWCDEYGSEGNAATIYKTFKRCAAFGKRLRAFFTAGELDELSKIQ